MATKIKVIVLSGNGTNCEMEMAHACRLAGASIVDIVHFSDLISGQVQLANYHFLNLPGGFLDGDDLGSAKAGANRWKFIRQAENGERLLDQLLHFIRSGKLVLGVCNGFQLLVKLGILPALDLHYAVQQVTLTNNDSGHFEDRWVNLKILKESPCVFTRGLRSIYLPVRHGEGKLVCRNSGILKQLFSGKQVVLQYVDAKTGQPTPHYPDNPNGSVKAIAGLCDPHGRVFGLMPHPEAFLHYTNHPQFTRHSFRSEAGEGLRLFENAIQYIDKNI